MRRLSANNTLYKQDINDSISNISRVFIELLQGLRGFFKTKNNVPCAAFNKDNSHYNCTTNLVF